MEKKYSFVFVSFFVGVFIHRFFGIYTGERGYFFKIKYKIVERKVSESLIKLP